MDWKTMELSDPTSDLIVGNRYILCYSFGSWNNVRLLVKFIGYKDAERIVLDIVSGPAAFRFKGLSWDINEVSLYEPFCFTKKKALVSLQTLAYCQLSTMEMHLLRTNFDSYSVRAHCR